MKNNKKLDRSEDLPLCMWILFFIVLIWVGGAIFRIW